MIPERQTRIRDIRRHDVIKDISRIEALLTARDAVTLLVPVDEDRSQEGLLG
jgi:hypothetical protein